MKRLRLQDCIDSANKLSGKCLSDTYVNTKTPMRWKCKNDHVWNTAYANIRAGKWCPECAGVARITEQKCHDIASKSGGRWVSAKYMNNCSKMLWECDEGHRWEAIYASVSSGHWCPHCAGNAKLSIRDAQIAASESGGECMSSKYKNKDARLLWKCKLNHEWAASFGAIRKGQWCPYCADYINSKGQRKLTNIVKDIFYQHSVLNKYKRFSWLKTGGARGRRQEFDIFVPEIRLAIEYDGRQHFMPVNFGGISDRQAEENFRKQKKLDYRKNRMVKKYSKDVKYFIRFSYKEDLTKDYVINKLIKAGCPIEI